MNWLEGIRKAVEAVANPSIVNESRKDVFRDEFDKIIVDTVAAYDTGIWETGIWRDKGHFIVVEQYSDRERAEKGHAEWVCKLKENRNAELYDLDLWDLWGLDDD